eukprot:5565649-Karenia_brevis.AAC.1
MDADQKTCEEERQVLKQQLAATEHSSQDWMAQANILEEQNRHLQYYLQRCPDDGACRPEELHGAMPVVVSRLDDINC